MKFFALLFAILAIIPQALKGLAYEFYGMNKCVPGAAQCMIGGNDQGKVLGILYHPNFFNTTGLWIGVGGAAIGFIGMFIEQKIRDRNTNEVIDKAEAHRMHQAREQRDRGRMPRPGYADQGRRPQSARDRHDGRGRDRYNDRDDYEYDPEARYEGRNRRYRDDDDYYDDGPRRRR